VAFVGLGALGGLAGGSGAADRADATSAAPPTSTIAAAAAAIAGTRTRPVRFGPGLRRARERPRELARVREPIGRRLREAPRDDGLERLGNVPSARGQRRRRRPRDARRDRDRVVAHERSYARHELVQHDAERPDVAARIDARGRLELLGRHVRDDPIMVESAVAVIARDAPSSGFVSFEMPKSSTLTCERPSRRSTRNRFEIAVHDAERVRFGDRGARLRDVVGGDVDRQRTVVGEVAREVHAAQMLHHDVRTIPMATEVERAGHVLALDARRRLRLAQEPRLVRALRPEQLDRDLRAELEVPRAEHDAHAAVSEQALHAVLAADEVALRDARRELGALRALRQRGGEVTERARHLGGVGPRGGILREHLLDQRLEPERRLRALFAEERRHLEQDAREQRVRRLGGERRAAGEALEEDAAEGEHVARRRDLVVAPHALGRHVARRADEGSLRGQRRRVADARDAEVEQPSVARVIRPDEEDVRRFDVAMHDARRVDGGERVGEPRSDRDRILHREASEAEALREAAADEPFHHQEAPASERAVGDVADHARMVDGVGLGGGGGRDQRRVRPRRRGLAHVDVVRSRRAGRELDAVLRAGLDGQRVLPSRRPRVPLPVSERRAGVVAAPPFTST
jgi:hypothetical protein